MRPINDSIQHRVQAAQRFQRNQLAMNLTDSPNPPEKKA